MQSQDLATAPQPLPAFVLWALASLKYHVESADDGSVLLHLPEDQQGDFGGAAEVHLSFDGATHDDSIRVGLQSPFWKWLLSRLQQSELTPSIPQQEAVSVHDLTGPLFSAFTVADGKVHLSGCTLEDRPLVGVVWIAGGEGELRQAWLEPEGHCLDNDTVTALGLDALVPTDHSLPRLPAGRVAAWLASARQQVQEALPDQQIVIGRIAWCKFAAGKLALEIGDQAVEVSFAQWAALLASGQARPPAYHCPLVQRDSYHVAATDDGQISVAEGIDQCVLSGQRLLITELARCAITGRRARADLLATCPITGDCLVPDALLECASCGQQVSPSALQQGHCAACREMRPVSASDAPLAGILARFPKLRAWSRWRIAETSTAYIVTAAAWIKRLLIVLRKDDLQVLRLAQRQRFSSQWSDVANDARQELLGPHDQA